MIVCPAGAVVVVCVCAKATGDPTTIERITNVAKTAEKSFLLIIFHLQNRVVVLMRMIFYRRYKLCFSLLSDVTSYRKLQVHLKKQIRKNVIKGQQAEPNIDSEGRTCMATVGIPCRRTFTVPTCDTGEMQTLVHKLFYD
jgi:hypothetical protein